MIKTPAIAPLDDSNFGNPRTSAFVSDANSHCHDRTVSRVARVRQRQEQAQSEYGAHS